MPSEFDTPSILVRQKINKCYPEFKGDACCDMCICADEAMGRPSMDDQCVKLGVKTERPWFETPWCEIEAIAKASLSAKTFEEWLRRPDVQDRSVMAP